MKHAPIRSLIVIPRYWPSIGGSELHTRQLAHELKKQGNEIKVLCHVTTPEPDNELAASHASATILNDRDIVIHQAGVSGWLAPIIKSLAPCYHQTRWVRPVYDGAFRQISTHAIAHQAVGADLIHAVYNGMTSVTEAALAAARHRDIPFILTPLAFTGEPEGTAWSSRRFKKLYRQADALIALTEHERQWLVTQGAPENRTIVCPVGPLLETPSTLSQFRGHYGLDDHPVILFLARHSEDKGYRQLAESAKQVWQHHPDACFLFIGPQTAESKAFFRHAADPRIIVIESISQADKNAALASCDLLCIPSRKESLGVTYLEAWHYGKPVVAADLEVLRTIIDNGKNGLLCLPTPSSIATAILRLLASPSLRRRLGQAGQLKVQGYYHWPHIATTVGNLYQSVLKRSQNHSYPSHPLFFPQTDSPPRSIKEKTTMPTFSVVMPVYNVADFIAEAIQSVLNQSFIDFELLIVDDCSPDNSIQICRQFNDPRIRIIKHTENRGLAGARNTGIRHALGEFIAFLDSDDRWHPDKLSLHHAHLIASPQVGLSFSRSAFIEANGVATNCYQMPRLTGITPDHLFCRNPVGNGSAPVVRMSALVQIGYQAIFNGQPEIRYFDSTLRRSEDIECWLRIALTTDWQIEGIPQVLTDYRLNAEGLSASLFKQLESWESLVSKTRHYAPAFIAQHEQHARAFQFRYLARQAIRLGDGSAAVHFLHRALGSDWRLLTHEPARTFITCVAAYLLRRLPMLYQKIEQQGYWLIGRWQKRRINLDLKQS